jgi:hypothetical protein
VAVLDLGEIRVLADGQQPVRRLGKDVMTALLTSSSAFHGE